MYFDDGTNPYAQISDQAAIFNSATDVRMGMTLLLIIVFSAVLSFRGLRA